MLFAMSLAAQTPGDCPETAAWITECGINYSGNNGTFTDNCGGDMCGCVGGNSNPSNFDNDCLTTYVGGNCGSDFAGSIENSMWWAFTPTESCDYEISITPYNCCCAQGPGPDFMQVWIGQMSGGSVTSYLVNDNSNTALTGGVTTVYTVPVSIADGGVYIMLDGNAGAECDLDVSIQPSANCGDLCPLILSTDIISFTGEIVGISAWIRLEVGGSPETNWWECEWSSDGIHWWSLGGKYAQGFETLKWVHYEWGQTYYRVKRDGLISKTIALWNPTLKKEVRQRLTPVGQTIYNIHSYRGIYIEEYTDGTREFLVR